MFNSMWRHRVYSLVVQHCGGFSECCCLLSRIMALIVAILDPQRMSFCWDCMFLGVACLDRVLVARRLLYKCVLKAHKHLEVLLLLLAV